MVIISREFATPDVTKYLAQGINGYSLQKIGIVGKNDLVAFVAKDGDIIVGGITVEVFYGQLHIKLLFVEDEYRKYGVGKKLMEQALNFGREMKCPQAFVKTMSFQALGFYQKLGFSIEFSRDGYASGAKNHYLRKDL